MDKTKNLEEFQAENLEKSQELFKSLMEAYAEFAENPENASVQIVEKVQKLTDKLFENVLKLSYGDKIGNVQSTAVMPAKRLPAWVEKTLCMVLENDPRLCSREVMSQAAKFNLWEVFQKNNKILDKKNMQSSIIAIAFESKLEHILCSAAEYNPEIVDARFLLDACTNHMENVCSKAIEVMESEEYLKYNENRDLFTYSTVLQTLKAERRSTALLEKCAKNNEKLCKKIQQKNLPTTNFSK